MLLSIIVPVYKVEPYLDRCVESILAQGLDDFELLLIDDGSPDRCPQMCDLWAKKDRHIKVYHQDNGGLSAARNTGLDHAQGNLITFVDSDDALAANTLQTNIEFMQSHKDIDFVQFPTLFDVGQQSEHAHAPAERTIVQDDILRDWHNNKPILNSAWGKIYRSELFHNNGAPIRFRVRHLFEDKFMMFQLLPHLKKIHLSRAGVYLYYLNGGSILRTPSLQLTTDWIESEQIMLALMAERADMQQELSGRYMHSVRDMMNMQFAYPQADIDSMLSQFESLLPQIPQKGSIKDRFWLRLMRLFGCQRFARIYGSLLKLLHKN